MTAPGDNLEATQRWMQAAVTDPGRGAAGDIAARLDDSGRLTAAGGLAIYRRGYFLRIAACMREQFPALCHALDEPLFNDFVEDYLHACPPESHTLYDLGRRFPGFLEASRPDHDRPAEAREGWIDFMIDLARFERSVFVMFDAPGDEGRPLARADTPNERLRLQAAFALGAYRYPVASYYHAVRQQQPAQLPAAATSFVALVRTDYVTRTIPLAEPHYRFLQTLAGGGDVDAAIGAMAAHLGAAPDEVRRTWNAPDGIRRRWTDWGFFVEAGQPA